MTQPNPAPAPQAGPTPPTPPAPPVQPPTQPPVPAAPWGDDANFDPAKAWTLIQNLRADSEALKSQVAQLRPLAEALGGVPSPEVKTDLDRLTERFSQYEKQVAERATEALRLRVALKHGISDEDAALFLTANDEATLTKVAEALAARSVPPATPPATPPAPGRTPVEALRPGALPNPPAPNLNDQIAAARKEGNWRLAMQLENSKLANAGS